MTSKYAYDQEQERTLVRSNSATKIQARVRGARARSTDNVRSKNKARQQRQQQRIDQERSSSLVRTNSATKIQARVRGTRGREDTRRHKRVIESDNDSVLSDNSDPELDHLKQRRDNLKVMYREYRERGKNGKMQLTLLDFDIADKEYRMALAYRVEAANKVENRDCHGMLACACLPCLLCIQFLCCTSTGSVGERRQTVKDRDETIQKLKSLGNDYMNTKQAKVKKTPRVRKIKR
jgi:hypothetical protein